MDNIQFVDKRWGNLSTRTVTFAPPLPVDNNDSAYVYDVIELGRFAGRKIHAAVATIAVAIHRTAEIGLPGSIVQRVHVANERHPVSHR